MISIPMILYLLFAHWVADFLCQTTEMGTMKSKDHVVLIKHTAVYSTVMSLFMVPLIWIPLINVVTFWIITFVCHTAQDYITSKITSKRFSQQLYNGWTGAFTVIGFDQWLHYIQIFITYYLLTNQ